MAVLRLGAALAVASLWPVGIVTAYAASSPAWRATKCERYAKAWSGALARFGSQGLGRAFLDRHAAFLGSGCSIKGDVCPRSDAELRIANAMVVLSMDAGTASTFPPFACPR